MTLGFDNLRSDFMFPKQEYDVFDRYYAPRPGLERTPTEIIGAGRARLESEARAQTQKLRGEVENRFREGAKQLSRNLPPLPPLPPFPTSPEEAIRMGLREAGFPDSPEAAVNLIAKEMGASVPFPIPIPLPASIEEAVLLGVEWAAQAYGPQVLALIGAGSVVPGVGNAVGLVIAVVKMLADSGFAPAAVPPRAWECKTGFNFPPGTSSMTAILRMADVQTELLKVKQHRLADPDNKTGNYLPASRVACVTRKTAELRRLHKYVVGSEKTATMPEINAALAAFDYWKVLFAQWQKALAARNKTRQAALWNKHPQLRFEPETRQVITALQNRRNAMFKLAADVQAFLREPVPTTASGLSQKIGRLGSLERRVLAEVRIASIGVVRAAKDPSMKRKNLQQLAGYTRSFDTLKNVQQDLIKKLNTAMGRKELPRTEEGLKEQQFRFEMENCGGSPGCEAAVRTKYGKSAPSPSTPSRPAPPVRTRGSTLTPQQRAAFAVMAWKNWLRGARSDQLAKRPVRQPPPIPPRNPPGLPGEWVVWLNRARMAQKAGRPVKFPPAIPAAWVR